VGVATFRSEGRRRQGALTRRVSTRTYRLLGGFGTIDLDREATDLFLQKVRQGFHGGPGRCQGKMTADGFSYTRETSLTLPVDVVRWATRFGGGVFSIGVRRMVASVIERAAAGSVEAAGVAAAPLETGKDGRKVKTKVYLDRHSMDHLRALGDGNVSKGLRITHGILAL
jgi:hypothetical protein